MATLRSIQDWQFQQNNVDPEAFRRDSSGARGNYISSESVVLAAGPSTLAAALNNNMEDIVPIGVCDTVQVSQNKGVIQLYEIGSRLPYIIPGRPITQFQISRVLFNGDSLLSAMTMGLWRNGDIDPTSYAGQVMGGPGTDNSSSSSPDRQSYFFLNLASQFFNNPIGLGLYLRDSENEWIAGFYAENCVIQSHTMAIQGQNMIVMENASVRCTTFVPIETPGASTTDSIP